MRSRGNDWGAGYRGCISLKGYQGHYGHGRTGAKVCEETDLNRIITHSLIADIQVKNSYEGFINCNQILGPWILLVHIQLKMKHNKKSYQFVA